MAHVKLSVRSLGIWDLLFQFDETGLKSLEDALKGVVGGRATRGLLDPVYEKWRKEYQAELQAEFATNSAGGGAWPPHSRGPTRPILKVTNQLYNGLAARYRLVAKKRATEFGIEVLYSQKTHTVARMPVAELADIHHLGMGVVPVRRIWVPPSAEMATKAANHLRDWLRQKINETKNG